MLSFNIVSPRPPPPNFHPPLAPLCDFLSFVVESYHSSFLSPSFSSIRFLSLANFRHLLTHNLGGLSPPPLAHGTHTHKHTHAHLSLHPIRQSPPCLSQLFFSSLYTRDKCISVCSLFTVYSHFCLPAIRNQKKATKIETLCKKTQTNPAPLLPSAPPPPPPHLSSFPPHPHLVSRLAIS